MTGMTEPNPDAGANVLRHIGCAGRITQYRATGDGHIETVLSGNDHPVTCVTGTTHRAASNG
jgi:hypothetical protein